MKIGNRTISKTWQALFNQNNYRAFWNMMIYSPDFLGTMSRYLLNKGGYPFIVNVRTPTGSIKLTAYSYHDILTINEIFFREDYALNKQKTKETKYVIDIGSNIGISALYFLSRNSQSRAILFEPDSRNIKKLWMHLSAFKDRIILHEKAVSNYSGKVEFSIEESGRYGGIGRAYANKVSVDCVDINETLAQILREIPKIDILKIDTEGIELTILNSIREDILDRIDTIFYELDSETKEERLEESIIKRFNIEKQRTVRTLHKKAFYSLNSIP